MSACHAVRQDQRSWSGREHHVHRPLSEVFRDHRAESLGERRLRRHQRLLDVLAGVLAGGQEHVIVGVIGAGALEDLEVDLLANLGLDGGGILLRRGAHRGPSRRPLSHGSAGPLRARARLPAMRVLALETSTRAGGVALVDGERLVAEYVLDISVTHSERLLAAVDRVLADARWTPCRRRRAWPCWAASGCGSATPSAPPSWCRSTCDPPKRSFGVVRPRSVEPMRAGDLDEVLAIERASFTMPWSRGAFLYEIEQNRVARCHVVRDDDTIVGYLCIWEIADEIHVTNIAIHPAHRRRGIARDLLSGLIADARARDLRMLVLEVRPSHHQAIALYEWFNFRVTGGRRGYYYDTGEDALVMETRLATVSTAAGGNHWAG